MADPTELSSFEDAGTAHLAARMQGTTGLAFADWLAAELGKTPGQMNVALPDGASAICIEIRQRGNRLAAGRYADGTSALADLKERLSKTAGNGPIALILNILYPVLEGNPEAPKIRAAASPDINRGLLSYHFTAADGADWTVPASSVTATNRNWAKLREKADKTIGTPTRVTLFATEQYRLLPDRPAWTVTKLFRGRQLTTLRNLGEDALPELERQLGTYLIRAVNGDGRARYHVYPSRGDEAKTANNAIRQWMATAALIRMHRLHRFGNISDIIAQNIRYNLGVFYRQDGDLGLIVEGSAEGEKVKLGALALAALAMEMAPEGCVPDGPVAAISRTIDELWSEDGSFRTFLRPAERNDNQNFYSGEALLYWAFRIALKGDDALLPRFMASFAYYRDWHRRQRNPAFVPWHSQALCLVHAATAVPELADFVFEMNDWLLGIQQWEDAPTPDAMGRFYAPDQPFGPPHASATGVYLEGLADALHLAIRLKDDGRARQYETAILRGLRSVHQLTFKSDADLYYVQRRARLFGGVQTTVYDNRVRIDNVQHCLIGLSKYLELRAATTPTNGSR